jgi:hypothetical protein
MLDKFGDGYCRNFYASCAKVSMLHVSCFFKPEVLQLDVSMLHVFLEFLCLLCNYFYAIRRASNTSKYGFICLFVPFNMSLIIFYAHLQFSSICINVSFYSSIS